MTAAVDHTDVERPPHAWREVGPVGGLEPAGRPLVFLHGLGGTRESWNPQLDHFGRDRRCLAWDMPGYGAARPVEPLTFSTIADRLVALLDAAEIEQADLVGLSFGGMHALHTAICHPDRVGRLVLADTSPAFGMDGTRPDDWIADRLAPIEAGETPATMAEAVLDAIAARPLTGRVRADLVAGFRRISVEGFVAAVRCLPANDVRAELGSIDHPALVIVGELDRETPTAYARALADGLADARLHILPGVGHLSPSEDPSRFNTLVETFLREPCQSGADS